MGNSNYSGDAYRTLKSSYVGKATNTVFVNTAKRTLAADMDPKGLVFREARDSDAHPESYGISINLDVTGSMGHIAELIAREDLGKLMETLISHGIKDASVMFSAIGDHWTDHFPLQVGQFESGADELLHWLTSANLEGGGGGQTMESYLLAWLIAARHTSMDCFEKRGQRGCLFTIGDESTHPSVSARHLQELLGYKEAVDMTAEELLAEAQKSFYVFHIHANDGSYPDDPRILNPWRKLLGQNCIVLDDHTKIAELIASTVGLVHGIGIDTMVASFDSSTALAVRGALNHLSIPAINNSHTESVIRL